jgi:hypothetical protein
MLLAAMSAGAAGCLQHVAGAKSEIPIDVTGCAGQVRLWNVDTGECINSHNFLRPIASVAFNERADELAVAAGHKVHLVLLSKSPSARTHPYTCPDSGCTAPLPP